MTLQQAPRAGSQAWPQPCLTLAQSPDSLYADLVIDRIEERGKHVDLDVNTRARHLAEAYGNENATPRDVVDLHLAVVSRMTRNANHQRVGAVVASSQLVLVEVLGHLATHYRRRATS